MPATLRDIAETALPVYPNSIAEAGDATFFLAGPGSDKRLAVLAPPASPVLERFEGESSSLNGKTLLICPRSHANAGALRAVLPWLRPQLLGLRASAGCGDRLGLATPGHVRAAREFPGLAMIFPQQSVRELARTQRSVAEMADDALWGVFQEGWRAGFGADADHLKTPEDIDRFVAAGFTFFTFDPGGFVDAEADTADEAGVRARVTALPWQALETTERDLAGAHAGRRIEAAGRDFLIEEDALWRAVAKYGRAIAHTAALYRHLASRLPAGAFEVEVSVDETATPTTHVEHLVIARELQRLGVRWVSLAPRYIGRFEKGVDYIGDVNCFADDFAGHAAIARANGPYKLSLHSGSDKFSIYGVAAQAAGGLIHLKTAGTSYLEALRAAAGFDPGLVKEILAFALERYDVERATYHVSADPARVPAPATLQDSEVPGLLDQFDARQVLHVAFGSVLTSPLGFKERLFAGLAEHEEDHYAALERHFVRHLSLLAAH